MHLMLCQWHGDVEIRLSPQLMHMCFAMQSWVSPTAFSFQADEGVGGVGGGEAFALIMPTGRQYTHEYRLCDMVQT